MSIYSETAIARAKASDTMHGFLYQCREALQQIHTKSYSSKSLSITFVIKENSAIVVIKHSIIFLNGKSEIEKECDWFATYPSTFEPLCSFFDLFEYHLKSVINEFEKEIKVQQSKLL